MVEEAGEKNLWSQPFDSNTSEYAEQDGSQFFRKASGAEDDMRMRKEGGAIWWCCA